MSDGALPVRRALVLGLIQGPTELLPVSSSAHIVLVPWLAGWDWEAIDPEVRKSFEVALHTGAAAALLFGQRKLIAEELRSFDLRRALLKLAAQALSCRARDLMSPNPATIVDTTLALDAVAFMSERPRPITSLFVVSAAAPTVPVGLLRLHDLLAAKII